MTEAGDHPRRTVHDGPQPGSAGDADRLVEPRDRRGEPEYTTGPAGQDLPAAPAAPTGAPPATLPDGPSGPAGTAPAATTTVPRHVPRSRFGGVWIALTISAVILLLLLVFILENSSTVDVAYFGQHGHLPLGVALLLAAVFGVLVVAIPGYGRILQLRRAATHPDRATRPARTRGRGGSRRTR